MCKKSSWQMNENLGGQMNRVNKDLSSICHIRAKSGRFMRAVYIDVKDIRIKNLQNL